MSRDPGLLFKDFLIFVLPLLEYCCTLWSPYSLKNIKLLESIQRRFTKRLSGLWDIPYITRLDMLKAETLELRTLKIDLTMYYKIINGYSIFLSPRSSSFEKVLQGAMAKLYTRLNSITM